MAPKRYKIFLVEDEKVDQLAFQKMIETENISCDLTITTSAKEANEILKINHFDVIILDYIIEDGTAFDILENISDTPVIVCTGAGAEEVAVKAMKLGAYDYVVKDTKGKYLEVMAFTIERVIKQMKADQALKELSNLHEAVVNNSFDSFVVVNYKGIIIFANRAFKNISKYSIDELIDFNLGEITIGDELVSLLIDSAKEGRSFKELKTFLRPKHGQDIPVAASITPVSEQEKIIFCFRDLRIEQEARENLQYFQQFAAKHVFVSLFKWGVEGPVAIASEPLLFTNNENELLQKMAAFYSTNLPQDEENSSTLGLYGPFPIPHVSDHVALFYSFQIEDPDTDPRFKGESYGFISISIPKSLEKFFTNRKSIARILAKHLATKRIITQIDHTVIQQIKDEILDVEIG